jgi:GT2 family glycosyltransferase
VKVVGPRVKKPPVRPARNKLSDAGLSAPESDPAASAIHIDADKVFKIAVAGDAENKPPNGHEAQADGYPDQTSQKIFQLTDEAKGELIPAAIFDEAGYLRLNPDVRQAIEHGQFESGYSHYVLYGHVEGRPVPNMPTEVRNVLLASIGTEQPNVVSMQARCSIDALIIAPRGGLMIVGWIDDVTHPISCIRIISVGWRVVIDASRFVRVRRMDVEKAIGSRAPHSFGFFGFLHLDRGGDVSGPVTIELWQTGGIATALQCNATIVGDIELRNTALAHLAGASFFGNPGIESMAYLGQGVGAELIAFNKALTRRLVAVPYVERFGRQNGSPRGTIVVCLYGKSEFYFVQNCLFAGLPGIEEYEFVYVSNSPELAETLLREAQSASLIYGLTNSVMILPGNAGFGGANNAAARIARSDRLLIVNPDVFPRDRDWAKKHTDLLDTAAPEQTRLFGVPLYYDDGSLMHGGMYFDIDVGVTMASGRPSAQQICRVEHFGKGAPSDSPQFTRPRPVPAVTGAFLSIDSEWFEALGGFTEDFIFGHYEDADLCLKSIGKGVAPWLQDIRMWHLEGKGSTRQLAHEGGSLVNRWLFSQTWMRIIEAGLKGPTPEHGLFQPTSLPLSQISDAEPTKPKSARRRRVFG